MNDSKLPMTDERLKIWLGFSLGFAILLVLAALAMSIALGKVEEKTSYGLLGIISPLTTLAGTFAGWAFGKISNDSKSS